MTVQEAIRVTELGHHPDVVPRFQASHGLDRGLELNRVIDPLASLQSELGEVDRLPPGGAELGQVIGLNRQITAVLLQLHAHRPRHRELIDPFLAVQDLHFHQLAVFRHQRGDLEVCDFPSVNRALILGMASSLVRTSPVLSVGTAGTRPTDRLSSDPVAVRRLLEQELAGVDALINHAVPVILISAAEIGSHLEAVLVDLPWADDVAGTGLRVSQKEVGNLGER